MPIIGLKFIVVDKLAVAGKAKAVFVAKDTPTGVDVAGWGTRVRERALCDLSSEVTDRPSQSDVRRLVHAN